MFEVPSDPRVKGTAYCVRGSLIQRVPSPGRAIGPPARTLSEARWQAARERGSSQPTAPDTSARRPSF